MKMKWWILEFLGETDIDQCWKWHFGQWWSIYLKIVPYDVRQQWNWKLPIFYWSQVMWLSYKMQHMQFDIQYMIMARASLLASAITILRSCYIRPLFSGVLQNSMLCYAVSSFMFLPHGYCVPYFLKKKKNFTVYINCIWYCVIWGCFHTSIYCMLCKFSHAPPLLSSFLLLLVSFVPWDSLIFAFCANTHTQFNVSTLKSTKHKWEKTW